MSVNENKIKRRTNAVWLLAVEPFYSRDKSSQCCITESEHWYTEHGIFTLKHDLQFPACFYCRTHYFNKWAFKYSQLQKKKLFDNFHQLVFISVVRRETFYPAEETICVQEPETAPSEQNSSPRVFWGCFNLPVLQLWRTDLHQLIVSSDADLCWS